MKRTERGEVRARFFQRHTRADDVHDVAGTTDAFEGCGGNSGHARSVARCAGQLPMWIIGIFFAGTFTFLPFGPVVLIKKVPR